MVANSYLCNVITWANNECRTAEKLEDSLEIIRRIKQLTRSYMIASDDLSVYTAQDEPSRKGKGPTCFYSEKFNENIFI